jgi:hypothetical protein
MANYLRLHGSPPSVPGHRPKVLDSPGRVALYCGPVPSRMLWQRWCTDRFQPLSPQRLETVWLRVQNSGTATLRLRVSSLELARLPLIIGSPSRGHGRTSRHRNLSSGGHPRTRWDTRGHATDTVRDREAPGAIRALLLTSKSRQGRQKVWRTSTHPVRSRIQSQGVVRCHFVFRIGESISPTQNPAYSPPSAHRPHFEFKPSPERPARGNSRGTTR